MDDLKTKIKIKTLDLFILLSIKTRKVESVKSILSTRVNQVYYEMFIEKINKEMKSNGMLQENGRGNTADKRLYRNERTMVLTSRKHEKSNYLIDFRCWKYNSDISKEIFKYGATA